MEEELAAGLSLEQIAKLRQFRQDLLECRAPRSINSGILYSAVKLLQASKQCRLADAGKNLADLSEHLAELKRRLEHDFTAPECTSQMRDTVSEINSYIYEQLLEETEKNCGCRWAKEEARR